MSAENETIADIAAQMRNGTIPKHRTDHELLALYADRIEAAAKREKRLLKSCARWILTHDIYGNMAKELLAECKEVLHDDGRFLLSEEGAENVKV